MNQYCVPLNVNITPYNTDLLNPKTYDIDETILCHRMIPLTDISNEYHGFLSKFGLELVHAELFYNPPRKITNVHTDTTGGDYSKINFVYGGAKSLMCWHEPKPQVEPKIVEYNGINTRVINYARDEVSMVHKEHLHSPSIVQVGIPHNIIVAAEARWCLSTVPVIASTRRRPTMAETIEMLNDAIL